MSKTSTDPAHASGNSFRRHALNGATMGTRYSSVFFAPADMDVSRLAGALFEAVDRVDCQMSTWKPGSDLNRLNRAAIGEWIELPQEAISVLQMAAKVYRASGGAFDIGVGHHVAAWGFGAFATDEAPDLRSPNARLSKFASPILEIESNLGRARKIAPASLDLSGIAKGFGVDELARMMDEFGISSWLVGIDGEMRARGQHPDGTAWSVAQERPKHGSREILGVIELTDLAIATSGNYRHVRDINGRTVSHTIDPATGEPLDNGVLSVTVIAETCMEADAWATALMVMGPDAGMKAAAVHGLDAIFVLQDGSVMSSL